MMSFNSWDNTPKKTKFGIDSQAKDKVNQTKQSFKAENSLEKARNKKK